MVLYPRRDVLHVGVSGGCGASHTRTVTQGQPDPDWYLDCRPCELKLKDDPQWSATRHEVPETPDEVLKRESLQKQKDRSLEEIQTAAMAVMAGLDVPQFMPKTARGVVRCRQGHDNSPGAKFCAECGMNLNEMTPEAYDVALSSARLNADKLLRLPVGELRELAERHGINPKQNKRQLVEALSA